MLQVEEIELLAIEFVSNTPMHMTPTQKTIYRLLVDFGVKVAVKADQAEKRKASAQ